MLSPGWTFVLPLLFMSVYCLGQEPGDQDMELPLQYYDDNVIDLLEALNITRSIKGITKSKGRDPGSPAWKFRPRVPHLTLPWDYSVYLLSSTQGSIGLHFVAKQAKNNQGTLLAFLSEAAMKRDGHPLLRLVSDTQADQLRLEYRTPQTIEPASLLLPGGSPFSGSKWARLALNIDIHKVTLFLDCEEPVVFGKEGEEEILSLILPLDLQISFASTPGNKESKFLGYWQTAEISPTGFSRRPWHCENRSDSLPLPYSLSEERHTDDEDIQRQPRAPDVSDTQHYQQQQSEVPSTFLSQEERMRRLEEVVQGLTNMLDMVKVQNADLQARVKALESCECRRPTCLWEGKEYQDSETWKKDTCNICVCIGGSVKCSLHKDWPQCLACSYEGRTYNNKETFSVGSCTSCVCQNGEVTCIQKTCSPVECTHPVTPPGECCPRCVRGCSDGHLDGDTWKKDSCISCTCQGSSVKCISDICDTITCEHPFTPPGKCCPECINCQYHGQILRNGERFQPDLCTICTCKNGTVQCGRERCPELTCIKKYTPPGQCCAVCQQGCEYEGVSYRNGDYFLSKSNPCVNCSCLRTDKGSRPMCVFTKGKLWVFGDDTKESYGYWFPAERNILNENILNKLENLALQVTQYQNEQKENQKAIQVFIKELKELNSQQDTSELQEEEKDIAKQKINLLEQLKLQIPIRNTGKEKDESPVLINDHPLLPGQKVLSICSHNGWYEEGSIIHDFGDFTYFVEKPSGEVARIHRDDLLTDTDDYKKEIKEDDPVIGPHPLHPGSYCPGVVLNCTPDLKVRVRCYDTTEAFAPREHIYLISPEKYKNDTSYILACEERWVGQPVVARNDETGTFHLAEVKKPTKICKKYVISWADGTTAIQDMEWIFGRFSQPHVLNVGDHVLTLAYPSSLTFLPGIITAINGTKLQILFCNGKRCQNMEAHHCFGLSEKTYDSAVQFYYESNQTIDSDEDHISSDNEDSLSDVSSFTISSIDSEKKPVIGL